MDMDVEDDDPAVSKKPKEHVRSREASRGRTTSARDSSDDGERSSKTKKNKDVSLSSLSEHEPRVQKAKEEVARQIKN